MLPESLKTREDIVAAIDAALNAGQDELVIEDWDIELTSSWRRFDVPDGFSLVFRNNRFHEPMPERDVTRPSTGGHSHA